MDEHTAVQTAKLGERIRAARIAQRMSQADLAAKAGIDLPRISNIELGKVAMRIPTFVKIAEALDVSADHLLRLNTKEGKAVYEGEFLKIVEDCTPEEIESLLLIVQQVKKSLHSRSPENSE